MVSVPSGAGRDGCCPMRGLSLWLVCPQVLVVRLIVVSDRPMYCVKPTMTRSPVTKSCA